MPEASKDLRDAMTDINGKEHFNTVPRDLLQPRTWEKQKAIGLAHVPPQFAEVFEQTKTTFISKINDVASPEAVIKDRLFFVGDALNTPRPHTAQGANQAAFHCRMLEGVIKGHLKPRVWGDEVMRQSRVTAAMSRVVGMYGLRKWLALIWAVMKVLTLVIDLKLKGILNRIMGRRQTNHYESWTSERTDDA
jgi:hypothetical protein